MKNKTRLTLYLTMGFLAIFSYLGLPMFMPKIENRDPKTQFWNITPLPHSKSYEVMGITFGKTTLEAAIKRFGNRFELAVYVEKDQTMQLEVYFRETEVGTFTGRIAATLYATETEMRAAIEQAGTGKALPDYRQKYILPENGHLPFLNHTFKSIAFIPTAVSLDETIIHERFGQENQLIKEKVRDGTVTHYLYPEKGLDIQMNTNGPDIIQYIEPADFNTHILQPLEKIMATP